MGSAIQPFGSQTTGRADPLLWGKTLPQFEARFSRDGSIWQESMNGRATRLGFNWSDAG